MFRNDKYNRFFMLGAFMLLVLKEQTIVYKCCARVNSPKIKLTCLLKDTWNAAFVIKEELKKSAKPPNSPPW
jgi:hypothetical protein